MNRFFFYFVRSCWERSWNEIAYWWSVDGLCRVLRRTLRTLLDAESAVIYNWLDMTLPLSQLYHQTRIEKINGIPMRRKRATKKMKTKKQKVTARGTTAMRLCCYISQRKGLCASREALCQTSPLFVTLFVRWGHRNEERVGHQQLYIFQTSSLFKISVHFFWFDRLRER